METRSPTGCKQEAPTRSDSIVAWGMLVPPSWLRCHQSSSLWLRLDLKTYYKKGPSVAREGRRLRDRKHWNRESTGCRQRILEGENATGITSGRLLHPPPASPSAPPSRSAPLHHHLLQDLIIPTVISWQTWCMTQYTPFPWSVVFICPCLSSNLLLVIVKFFVDWLHTSLLSSMMVLCTDI
jgi:hypothetical protein